MTSLFDAPLSPSKTYWGFVGAFLFLVVGLAFLLGASGWQLLVLIGVFAGLVYVGNHKPTPHSFGKFAKFERLATFDAYHTGQSAVARAIDKYQNVHIWSVVGFSD